MVMRIQERTRSRVLLLCDVGTSIHECSLYCTIYRKEMKINCEREEGTRGENSRLQVHMQLYTVRGTII